MKTLVALIGILMAALLAACGANPAPPSASDSQAEQARSFAEPILKTVRWRTSPRPTSSFWSSGSSASFARCAPR